MPINWDGIKSSESSLLTVPREIYSSLGGRKWSRLQPEQSEVLEEWYQRRTESDLVIKQNTGSGKTLTGLLVAQSGLNEGVGPSVYIVPDKFLTKQVIAEANDAHIPVTNNPDDLDFLASQSILVTNFYMLLNGRSHFGTLGSRKIIPLGTVVVDDAHAALANADGLFSVSIPQRCAAFGQLLNLFKSELRHQSPKDYASIEVGDFSSPIRVSPSAVKAHANEMLDIIRPFTNDATVPSIFYPWPYVANILQLCVVTVSTRSIEINTPCPDVTMIPSFSQANRRVYLTATLADEGELVTELDANPESIKKLIVPKRASDLGDRIILSPLAINPRMDESVIHKLARAFADGDRDMDGVVDSPAINVVVLVPSDKAAEQWKNDQDIVLHVDNMQEYIEKMKLGKHMGIVVLVNKYDGVDLPDEACRLLILDGVPAPKTPGEQREDSALTRSLLFHAKQVQKTEQGMGRGTRNISDYCAVLLVKAEEALTLRDTNLMQFYSPATRAQITLSNQLANQIKGEGPVPIADLLNQFLRRDSRWVDRSLAATAGVSYESQGSVSQLAIARRKAFNAASREDYNLAVQILREALDQVSDPLESGWYMEELATYLEFVNPSKAQRCLASAKKRNPAVLMPDVPPVYKKISSPQAQAQASAEYLSRYDDSINMELETMNLLNQIVWGSEHTADQSEEALKQLGIILGFNASRPEKEQQNGGPDVLWAMSKERYAVIELKTEVRRQDKTIIKAEAEQLTHSASAWFPEEYPSIQSLIPVLLHPSAQLDKKAHLPDGSRIITEACMHKLKNDVIGYIRQLRDIHGWVKPDEVIKALTSFHLTADQIIGVHSVKPKNLR